LHLILGCYTPLGWLERCPTYKEQIEQLKEKDITNYAFLGYPCLQAADIVLYKAHVVPVGEDQLPHLELTREIVRRFNNLVGQEVFPEPAAKLTQAARLLGLDRRKMSKSYGNQIDIADDEATVERKVTSMITDPKRIRFKDPGHPEECNVCQWYKVFGPVDYADIADKCTNSKWGCTDCKKNLARILNAFLSEPRSKRRELEADPALVERILKRGAEQANAMAEQTMREVRALTGLGPKP
jgi:tryptophanyl-tRNA synthetase